MPTKRITDSQTGKVHVVDWPDGMPTSGFAAQRLAQQLIDQDEPPAGMAPPALGGPQAAPQGKGPAAPNADVRGRLNEAINAQPVDRGTFSERFPNMMGAVPSALAGISSALNTPISKHLGFSTQDSPAETSYLDQVSQFDPNAASEMAGGNLIRRNVTPGQLMSLPVGGGAVGAVSGGLAALAGLHEAIAPESTPVQRGMGGLQAVLGGIQGWSGARGLRGGAGAPSEPSVPSAGPSATAAPAPKATITSPAAPRPEPRLSPAAQAKIAQLVEEKVGGAIDSAPGVPHQTAVEGIDASVAQTQADAARFRAARVAQEGQAARGDAAFNKSVFGPPEADVRAGQAGLSDLDKAIEGQHAAAAKARTATLRQEALLAKQEADAQRARSIIGKADEAKSDSDVATSMAEEAKVHALAARSQKVDDLYNTARGASEAPPTGAAPMAPPAPAAPMATAPAAPADAKFAESQRGADQLGSYLKQRFGSEDAGVDAINQANPQMRGTMPAEPPAAPVAMPAQAPEAAAAEDLATKMMSRVEAAERLGVSTKTIRRMIKAGQLPASRVGRAVQIGERDIEAISKTRSTSTPIKPDILPSDPADLPTPAAPSAARQRIDQVLKGDPGFAKKLAKMDPAQRQEVYRELGGRRSQAFKDATEAGQPEPTVDRKVLQTWLKDFQKRSKGESGGIDVAGIASQPGIRAAIGGAVGGAIDPVGIAKGEPGEDRYTSALAGAVSAGMLGPGGGGNFLRQADRLRYESLLAGPAQLANGLGNTGTLLSAPVLEASRGNWRGAQDLAASYLTKNAGRTLVDGFKEGWNAKEPMKFTGQLPLGWSGRALNAADRGTRNVLESGGLTPEMAQTYTMAGPARTEWGRGLQQLQQLPGVSLVTPFARTAINQLEIGAAHSPLRAISSELRNAYPVTPRANGGSELLNPAQYTAMVPGAAALALGASGYGAASPTLAAAAGGLQAPFSIGRDAYDAHQFSDNLGFGRAASRQVPVFGDLVKTVEDSGQSFIPKLIQSTLPTGLMAIGDKTVRDPKGDDPLDVEGYLKERLPWERASLPVKPDFFGRPQQRNIFGGMPDPIYDTDPRAAALAEMGLLRRGQSGEMGQADLSPEEQADLKMTRGRRMTQVLDPFLANPSQLSNFGDPVQSYLQGLPPNKQQPADELIKDLTGGSGMPRGRQGIFKMLQQLGIQLGTNEFKAKRDTRLANELTTP